MADAHNYHDSFDYCQQDGLSAKKLNLLPNLEHFYFSTDPCHMPVQKERVPEYTAGVKTWQVLLAWVDH